MPARRPPPPPLPKVIYAPQAAPVRHEAVQFGSTPWHMWGNKVELVSTVTSGTTISPANAQLLKVAYGRPETWSFWFGARIVQASALSTGCTIQALVDVTPGVGRTVFQTEQPASMGLGAVPGRAFSKFVWDVPAGPGTDLLALPKKWSTRGVTPLTDDRDATSFQFVDWIAAQDLQVGVTLLLTTIDQEITVRVEVTGLVAPRTHLRPEWFGEDPTRQFRGGENNGS